MTLDGTGSSDTDGQTLAFSWVLEIRPVLSFAAIGDATTAAPTFTPDVAGSYVIRLVVNDGRVDSAPDTVTISVPEGVLLQGGPSERAVDRLVEHAPIPASATDIVNGYLLTRIDVSLGASATVAEINQALAAVAGTIVGMSPRSSALVVGVPRQPDAASLEALAARIAEQPGVAFAFAGRTADPLEAPPSPANGAANLQHLQDAGFVAAWNARSAARDCANNRVRIIVPDFFDRGNGVTYNSRYLSFASQVGVVPPPPVNPASATSSDHGYDVLTTMAAAFDAVPPTGAFPMPECLDIRPIEITAHSMNGIAQAIDREVPGAGNVMVSHSWGFPSCRASPCSATDPSTFDMLSALEMAVVSGHFRRMMNRHRHELLTVSAAGNGANKAITARFPGLGDSAYESPPNVAAKSDASMSWVIDSGLWEHCSTDFCRSYSASREEAAQLVAHLASHNQVEQPAPALLVGSVNASGLNEPSAFSEAGDVDAVGVGIPTLPGTAQGTSFSAPQVTALAAYLWVLSPELRALPVTDTIAAIRANICTIVCAGLINAYDTVLALDSGQPLSAINSRIRLALLDVNNSRTFDGTDLFAFRNAYRPQGQATEPTTRDDSRHDLNGDGYTGGSRRAPFDLDPESSPRFRRAVLTQVTAEIGGELTTYDENDVTDAEILCYYAYSNLYDASTESARQARDTYLAGLCSPIAVVVEPDDALVAPGASLQFEVIVRGTANQDVTWSLPNGGGTISATGLFAAGSVHGTYTVRAVSTADSNASAEVSVRVAAPLAFLTSTFSLGVVIQMPDTFPTTRTGSSRDAGAIVSVSAVLPETTVMGSGSSYYRGSGTVNATRVMSSEPGGIVVVTTTADADLRMEQIDWQPENALGNILGYFADRWCFELARPYDVAALWTSLPLQQAPQPAFADSQGNVIAPQSGETVRLGVGLWCKRDDPLGRGYPFTQRYTATPEEPIPSFNSILTFRPAP